MEEKKNPGNQEQGSPRETEVSGDYIKDIRPRLEPKADDHIHAAHNEERARAGHSGEGDRTDTDEMHGLNSGAA